MKFIYLVLFAAGFLQLCGGQMSASDFITDINPECPHNVTEGGVAKVVIATDVPNAFPYAFCADDWDFDFTLREDGNWSLDVVFPGASIDTSSVCVFSKNETSEVYTIRAAVPLLIGLLIYDSPEHKVECSYEADSTNTVQYYSQSEVSLCQADLLENCFTGRIRLETPTILKAELSADVPPGQSLQVEACDAVGTTATYPLFVNGCGDGFIIPTNEGFVTTGRKALSYSFGHFRMYSTRTIVFQCTFRVCETNCDGRSCNAP